MRSKIRSLISIIRRVGLAVAGLGIWVFATLAEGVLGKQSYAFAKDLTVNRDDENPVILKIHNGQGTNATQLLA